MNNILMLIEYRINMKVWNSCRISVTAVNYLTEHIMVKASFAR